MMMALCGLAFFAGCAQIPWMPGKEGEPPATESPPALPFPKELYTTAIESVMLIDDSALKKDAHPYTKIQPTPPKGDVQLVEPPGSKPPAAITMAPGSAGVAIAQAPPTGLTGPPGSPTSYPTPRIEVRASPEPPPRLAGREPVIDAFIALIDGRMDEYRNQLEHYDPATRGVFERVLPLLARLTQKRDMPSEGGPGWLPEAKSLVEFLLPQTELIIDKVCFCEKVIAFGNYQPVAESHVFRTGEQVQLYVELRNFTSERRGEFYETSLKSLVEIRDKEGKVMWSHDFDGKGHLIRLRSQPHDYFNNYAFRMPSLPHGSYTLTIRILDQTRPEVREKSKTTPAFRVGSGASR